jgi:hypothetical protein
MAQIHGFVPAPARTLPFVPDPTTEFVLPTAPAPTTAAGHGWGSFYDNNQPGEGE